MDQLPVPVVQTVPPPSEDTIPPTARRPSLRRWGAAICCLFSLIPLTDTVGGAIRNISGEGGATDYLINRVFGEERCAVHGDMAASLILQNFGVTAPALLPDKADSEITDPPEQKNEEEDPPAPLTEEQLYAFDFDDVPSGAYPIVPRDFSVSELSCINETGYEPEWDSLPALDATPAGDGPLVLILHTHGTEAYSEEGSLWYTSEENIPRSDDITKNVVAVGEEMAQTLREAGIGVLHCETMHDKESYKESYTRSAETIKAMLKEYPTIRYVLDVHRDSILGSDNTKYRPVALVDGKATAQVMLVVGSDYKGADHPNWKKNLALAAVLERRMLENEPGMARAVNLRGAAFNQQFTPDSLLLEIGSCGNTLAEAKEAGHLVAQELAAVILERQSGT